MSSLKLYRKTVIILHFLENSIKISYFTLTIPVFCPLILNNMHKVKFIQILKTLSKVELKHFGKFLESPIYNTNSTLVKLFNYAKKYYPAFDHTGLKKEMVYKKLFPDEHFKEKKLRNLSSEMLKITESFLLMNYFKNEFIERELILLKILAERDLENLYSSKHKSLTDLVEKAISMESIDYYNKYLIIRSFNDYYMPKSNTKILGKPHEQIRKFINFLLSELLDLYLKLTVINNHFKMDFQLPLLDEVLSYIKKNENILNNDPYLKIKYYKLLLFQESDEKYYFLIRDFLFDNLNNLSTNSMEDLLYTLINFALMKEYHSKHDFSKDLYILMSKYIEMGFYSQSNNDVIFLNYIKLCCSLKKSILAEKFMKKYSHNLNSKEARDIINVSLATIYFSNKLYDKALTHSNLIKSQNWYFVINSKQISVMSLFELNRKDQINRVLVSFFNFLKKNPKTLSMFSKSALGFVKCCKYLLELEKRGKINNLYFIKNLENVSNKSVKKWLINKKSQLLNSRL